MDRRCDTPYQSTGPGSQEKALASCRARHGANPQTCQVYDHNGDMCKAGTTIPDTFDAREQWPMCEEVIGRVRNQGQCGSCCAFAAANAVGGRMCIGSGGSFSGASACISAGYMASCATKAMVDKSNGCKGGNPHLAILWMASNGVPTGGNGLSTCVPYFGVPSALHHWNRRRRIGAPPCPTSCHAGYTRSLKEDLHQPKALHDSFWTRDLNVAMYNLYRFGPIIMAYFAYPDHLSYKSGIYRRGIVPKDTNHLTVVIGYGPGYVLSVNSWGARWGEQGRFRMVTEEVFMYAIPGDLNSYGDSLKETDTLGRTGKVSAIPIPTTTTTTWPSISWQCSSPKDFWEKYCGLTEDKGFVMMAERVIVMTPTCGAMYYGPSAKDSLHRCQTETRQTCYVYDSNGAKCPKSEVSG